MPDWWNFATRSSGCLEEELGRLKERSGGGNTIGSIRFDGDAESFLHQESWESWAGLSIVSPWVNGPIAISAVATDTSGRVLSGYCASQVEMLLQGLEKVVVYSSGGLAASARFKGHAGPMTQCPTP